MAGFMHEADHAHSIQSTWWLHRLATDVPLIACVINSPNTFTYYLKLSNFILEFGLSYFRVLTICLLLVYFVSAAGCHYFDLSGWVGGSWLASLVDQMNFESEVLLARFWLLNVNLW